MKANRILAEISLAVAILAFAVAFLALARAGAAIRAHNDLVTEMNRQAEAVAETLRSAVDLIPGAKAAGALLKAVANPETARRRLEERRRWDEATPEDRRGMRRP